VKINKFHKLTIDKAYIDGDYYSDKAPGLSFTALPILAIARPGLKLVFHIFDISETKIHAVLTWLSTFFTSGLMTAMAALALYFVTLQTTTSISGAIFATLSFGLATPAWGWATAFFGHAMAGACLFLAFTTIYYMNRLPLDRWQDILLGFLTGGLLSWAVVVEFPAAPAAGIISIFGLSIALHWNRDRCIRALLSAMLGGLIFIVPLLFYNSFAFGSPFDIGYSNVKGFEGMKQGFFGITHPRLDILYKIIFSKYRGIIWISPIIILTPMAFFYFWRFIKSYRLLISIFLISLYYIVFNSSYYYWDGGYSTGPRHITPILPFLCLPLGVIWKIAKFNFRVIFIGILMLSIGISLICVSSGMMIPDHIDNPLFCYLIPMFIKGESKSLFHWAGFTGFVPLIPLLIVWIFSAFYIYRILVDMKCSMES
jgi:hypothetical protein